MRARLRLGSRPQGQRFAIEIVAIPVGIVVVALVVYWLATRPIRNHRPLGGANVIVTLGAAQGSELSFVADPTRPNVLFGSTESLHVWRSGDAGRTWHRSAGPQVECGFGWPRSAVGPDGREYLVFLVERGCNHLTPYLAVTSRSGPRAPWSPPVRVARPTWKYGYDDAPSLAVDPLSGRLYAAWSRNLDSQHTTVVTSTSDDGGRSWSAPQPLSARLRYPHSAQIAVGADGTVYAAGIDVRYGIWIARSTDHGRTFGAPRRAAPLLANPARWCGLTGYTPIPNEMKTCSGPDPRLVVSRDRVLVVYDDAGANGSLDVLAAGLDLRLQPEFRTRVEPPDSGKTQQFLPAAAVDPDTGVYWACWYDTTYDPNGHRSWFTCSASRTGRTWTPPERAAAHPSMTDDVFFYANEPGLYPSIAAAHGVAHVFWMDSHSIEAGADTYTAALPEHAAFALAAKR